ncbi:hypothetical protein Esi_0195_0037 [Ectocarpus siliculosus]|uniref:Uncharacterized protein n=1 Tax=Ectocarpus siliculosus TaxID=2880 RepID=D7FPQ7_ECTSI|nr:hypothetical protein Esi_0195_0037 [Ectocarpus siliculosus]|eukprot:CBJ30514.1 hypothetical protein Esi_0195_0037 [Ectocarpus siliculosus]
MPREYGNLTDDGAGSGVATTGIVSAAGRAEKLAARARGWKRLRGLPG